MCRQNIIQPHTKPMMDCNWHLSQLTINPAKKNAMGYFKNLLTGDQKKVYSSLNNRNVRMVGGVYAPETNPLAGRVVGPDTFQFKGVVQIMGTDNGKLALKKVFERKPFVAGDVGDVGDVVSGFVSDPDNLVQGQKIQFYIWPTYSVLE